MLWLWVLGGLVAWTVTAFAVAVVIGRGVRLADRWSPGTAASVPLTTAALEADSGLVRRPVAGPVRRRSIPLPPIGIALAGVAVALETTGFVTRLAGSTGPTARMLSMDASLSLPRLFVAALFAAAALAAVAGAGALPGRRAWWLGVGLVGGLIAAVKAGGTLHADAIGSLSAAIGGDATLALSGGIAAVVLGALFLLTRAERRDRRRVLGVLALYAVASVGLSAVSGWAWAYGAQWAATATYVEESSEALAGVAFLMAVLVGVAPRLVLPASWALRREADAQTLDLPEQLPGRPAVGRNARG